jgi:hypothetical protein
MKTSEFNKKFDLTKTAKGVRAVPKTGAGFTEALTSDGVPFNSEAQYYFFDESTQKVRQTIGLRRIDESWLGSFGLRIVKIENLRASQNDALTDGQNYFRKQIKNLQETIEKFESEKECLK